MHRRRERQKWQRWAADVGDVELDAGAVAAAAQLEAHLVGAVVGGLERVAGFAERVGPSRRAR